METLHRLGIADDRTFFALPHHMQALHLAHTRNHIKGAYVPEVDSGEGGGEFIPGRGADRLQVMRAIDKIRNSPPSPRVIEDARRVVSTLGLPEPLIAAARATLERAGVAP